MSFLSKGYDKLHKNFVEVLHGNEKGAQIQADAAQRALEAQQAEADRARQFAVDRGQIGIDAIREGAAHGVDAVQGGNAAAQDRLGSSLGALYASNNAAAGYLGAGPSGGINPYDVVGNQPGRLAQMYNENPLGNVQADPGFAFRQQQGEQAINRSAAARGGRLGGATLKALAGFNQDLASQEYGNAANRALSAYGARAGVAGQADQSQLAALMNQAGRSDAAAQAGREMDYRRQSDLANLATGYGDRQASVYGQQAQLDTGTGSQLAQLYSGQGSDIANAALGVGSQGTSLSQSLLPAFQGPVQFAGDAQRAQAQQNADLVKTGVSLWLNRK